LQIFDLLGEHTLVIGATNRLEDMDEAILRRFNYRIYYPMPKGDQVSLYLDFLQFSYNFKFKSDKIKVAFIHLFEGKSYADIQNKIINLLKLKIFSEKKATNKLIINGEDIEKLTSVF
jgi:AAA+ superfamily predicted ATPase